MFADAFELDVDVAGFVFLIILLVVVTFSDILRISTGKGIGG